MPTSLPDPKALRNLKHINPILRNCNSSGLGWCILDFSKPVGQGDFGAHSEAKLVSQFMQTKFFCHKMSQNSTVCPVS